MAKKLLAAILAVTAATACVATWATRPGDANGRYLQATRALGGTDAELLADGYAACALLEQPGVDADAVFFGLAVQLADRPDLQEQTPVLLHAAERLCPGHDVEQLLVDMGY